MSGSTVDKRMRVYEFVYERVLPSLPVRLPRVEAWLLRLGVERQESLAESVPQERAQ